MSLMAASRIAGAIFTSTVTFIFCSTGLNGSFCISIFGLSLTVLKFSRLAESAVKTVLAKAILSFLQHCPSSLVFMSSFLVISLVT
ncbi:unnamed protein product [Brassica oleracea]